MYIISKLILIRGRRGTVVQRLTVSETVVGSIPARGYELFSFTLSGNVFRSIRNVSKIGWYMGNGMS